MEVQEQKSNAFNWGNLGFPCCYALNLPIIIFPAGIDVQNCAICCIAVIMNGKGPWNKKLEQSVNTWNCYRSLFEVWGHAPFSNRQKIKKIWKDRSWNLHMHLFQHGKDLKLNLWWLRWGKISIRCIPALLPAVIHSHTQMLLLWIWKGLPIRLTVTEW